MRCSRLTGALVFAVMGIAACTTAARAEDPLTIVWSTPPTTMMLPVYVAQKKGFLGDLQLKEIYISGDANAMRTLISSNADVAAGDGTSNALITIAEGAKVKIVGSVQPITDFNFVMAPGKGDRVEDMAGKTFDSSGPGNIPDVLGRIMMKQHHVDLDSVHFITVTGGNPGMLQVVVAGRSDGALVNTVTALQVVRKGQVKIVAKAAEEQPAFGYIYTVARTETLADPKMAAKIQKFVEAGIEGSRFIMAHPDEAAEILHEHIPDLDAAYLGEVVHTLNDYKVWGTDGGIDRATAEKTLLTFQDVGVIKPTLTVATAYDFTFVDAALAKLGKPKLDKP